MKSVFEVCQKTVTIVIISCMYDIIVLTAKGIASIFAWTMPFKIYMYIYTIMYNLLG